MIAPMAISAEVLAEAKQWLASTDVTDGHIVADYLARAIVEASKPPAPSTASGDTYSNESLRLDLEDLDRAEYRIALVMNHPGSEPIEVKQRLLKRYRERLLSAVEMARKIPKPHTCSNTPPSDGAPVTCEGCRESFSIPMFVAASAGADWPGDIELPAVAAAPAPMSFEELSERARFLNFELSHAIGTTVGSQYVLRYEGSVAFEGTFSECGSFLAGWYSDRADMLRALIPAARDVRQRRIVDWACAAFGKAEATSLPQRGLRLLEEAIEAFQACGGDEAIAHKLVKYVFERPPGTIGQELGGVGVTVLALAAAAGLSADEEELREVDRVLSKPVGEFTARDASKNAAGFKMETESKA